MWSEEILFITCSTKLDEGRTATLYCFNKTLSTEVKKHYGELCYSAGLLSLRFLTCSYSFILFYILMIFISFTQTGSQLLNM